MDTRCHGCRARVLWATSGATGKRIPLDEDQVLPGTKGALILIGEVAFSLPGAVKRIANMFDVDDGDAYAVAHEEYSWHLAHFATCPVAAQFRKAGNPQ